MKCPACKEKPISLNLWFSGLNSIRWNCNNCGVALRANKGTWVSLSITLLLVIGIVIGMSVGGESSIMQTLTTFFDQTIGMLTGVTLTEKGVILVTMGPLVVILAVLSHYFIGGYKVKKEKEIPQPDSPN